MKVRDVGAEEEAAEAGEDGVPEPAMERRHGALFDHALEARAHDEVRARLESLHKVRHGAEVVGEVGVAHDDVCPARGREPAGEGRAIAGCGNGNHARPGRFRERLRAVRRAVVRDDDLALEARLRERGERLGDAARDCLGLVQTGHDDGNGERSGGGHDSLSPSPPRARRRSVFLGGA